MSGRDDRGRDVTDRLSRRFEQDSETEKTSKSDKTDKTDMSTSDSKTDESASSGKSSESDNIRDRPSVLMYLPEELHQELDLRFDEINLQHKREHGQALEKNRDYYPAVIKAALEGKDIEDVLDLEE